MDNGYDAFAIDNTRTTESDHPSVDRQYSTGVSLRSTYKGIAPLTLTGIGTYADSNIAYGYDSDWGNPVNGRPTPTITPNTKRGTAPRAASNCA